MPLLDDVMHVQVFRGLWRGLVVGVKVVCDDGKNEKMVMKNAHEIAILSALSHPNIMQVGLGGVAVCGCLFAPVDQPAKALSVP